MPQTEQRKQYMREYRKRNRARFREQYREYNKLWYRKKRNILSRLTTGTCGMGRRFEQLALSILKGSTDCNVETFKGKWDIEWNGLKIEVKSRKAYRGQFCFQVRHKEADYVLAFCLSETEKILAVVFVPQSAFKSGFGFSMKSKRSKFLKYLIDIKSFG